MADDTTEVPTRVVLYSIASGRREAAAEFRWSPESGVVLTVIDPGEGPLARRYHETGILFEAEGRVVTADEGPAFMRALVQPSRTSYTRLVDESRRDEPS